MMILEETESGKRSEGEKDGRIESVLKLIDRCGQLQRASRNKNR